MKQQRLLLKQLNYFWLLNFIFISLIGIRYWFQVFPLNKELFFSGKILVSIYLFLGYLGQMGLFAYLPAVLLIPLVFLFPKPKIIFPIAILSSGFIALYILIDTFVYNQYQFHITGIIWHMIYSGSSNEIFDFSWLEKILTTCLLLFIITLEVLFVLFVRKTQTWKPLKYWPILSVCGLLFSSYCFIFLGYGMPIFRQFIINAKFIPYYLSTFTTITLKGVNPDELNAKWAIYIVQPNQPSEPMRYPITPMVCHPPKHPYNIVIIMIDTWRFDMMTKEVTPHIYQFSKSTTQYLQHFSGGNCTQPGVFSLFYSLPATYWTSTIDNKLPPVFLNELQTQGYQTGIFASAPLTLPTFNLNVFKNIPNLQTSTPGTDPGMRDENITKEFANFIGKQNNQKPFFSFLFYDAAHTYCSVPNLTGPFKPSIPTCNRLILGDNSNAIPYINRYKNALYKIDNMVNQDLMLLQKRGLLKNTIVVITGDHGNEFNDNHLGYWGHASNFTHFQVQTPLLIYYPGRAPALVTYRTSHFDIVPTLLNTTLSCSTPIQDYSVGKLLSDSSPRPYLIVGSYIDFGIVEPKELISILPSGEYQVLDTTNRPLDNAQPSPDIMRQVFKEMRLYYKKS